MVHAVTQLLSILSCDATHLHSITSPLYAHGPIASICSLHIDACTGVCNIDQAIYAGSRPNSIHVPHVSYWEEKASCFLTFLCFLFFSFLFFILLTILFFLVTIFFSSICFFIMCTSLVLFLFPISFLAFLFFYIFFLIFCI